MEARVRACGRRPGARMPCCTFAAHRGCPAAAASHRARQCWAGHGRAVVPREAGHALLCAPPDGDVPAGARGTSFRPVCNRRAPRCAFLAPQLPLRRVETGLAAHGCRARAGARVPHRARLARRGSWRAKHAGRARRGRRCALLAVRPRFAHRARSRTRLRAVQPGRAHRAHGRGRQARAAARARQGFDPVARAGAPKPRGARAAAGLASRRGVCVGAGRAREFVWRAARAVVPLLAWKALSAARQGRVAGRAWLGA